MKKNITLKIDEKLLKLCRYEAVESDKSLSQWVADLCTRIASMNAKPVFIDTNFLFGTV